MAAHRVCSIDGCGKQVRAKGVCSGHYERMRRTGDYGPAILRHDNSGTCSVPGCIVRCESMGMCCAHYGRWRRYGDPLGGKRSIRGAAVRWLRENSGHSGDECLTFPFPLGRSGYGHVTMNGRLHRAANAMLRVAKGPPPTPDHVCAHSCGNGDRGCVNPMHLRWATASENMRDQYTHGTRVLGERHGMAKLTIGDVRRIREMSRSSTHDAIADKFGLSRSHVSGIIRGTEWAWLT